MPTLLIHGILLVSITLIAWMITGGIAYSYLEQKHTALIKKRLARWGLLSAMIALILTVLTVLRFLVG